MEGPYLVEIDAVDGQAIRLSLIEDGLSRRVHLETEVSTPVLIDSVLAAATKALVECKARGWWPKDEDELADAMKALHRPTR